MKVKSVAIASISAAVLTGGVALNTLAGEVSATSTLNLVFNGFCDGLSLTINNTTNAIAYGSNTGCVVDTTAGAIGNIKKVGGTIVVSGPYGGTTGTNVLFKIFKNKTFEAYQVTPTSLTLVNTGTWSPGTLAPSKAGRKAGVAR